MQQSILVLCILSFCFIEKIIPGSLHHFDNDIDNEKEQLVGTDDYLISMNKHSFPAHNRQTAPHEMVASLTNNDLPDDLKDEHHGVKMGKPWRECDDGYTNVTLDWDGNPDDYTCYQYERNLPYTVMSNSTEVCITRPFFMPSHYCMFTEITYDQAIPYYGDHRPLWPKFGEYNYLPPQRWLHSLEHGAIIFLYHPCAKADIVQKIRTVLIGCLRKYVISKNRNLDESAPFLLLSWGCKFFMSGFEEFDMVRFIRKHAMTAPESKTISQGWYNWQLLWESINPPIGSDFNETYICPGYPYI